MTVAIAYHPKGHEHFLAPDFSFVALSDESHVSEALEWILRAKKKSLPGPQKQKLLHEIQLWAGGNDVGSLRAASQKDWDQLRIPIIARVYLKHLLAQSCALTRQQLLECDFNNGLPIDWEAMKGNITSILNMGFTRNQALEAMVVCNKNVEKAVQYLVKGPDSQKIERDQSKKKQNQFVSPDRHHTIIQTRQMQNAEIETWRLQSREELEAEIVKKKEEIGNEKKKREELTSQRDHMAHERRLALFVEYLRGLLADKSLNVMEQQQLDAWKSRREITDKDTIEAYSKLGETSGSIDAKKTFGDTTQFGDECVVCMDPPKDHMLISCNHVCLCPNCADDYRSYENPECPICSEKISDIKQIIW